jgi:hypothetical protein
VHLLDTLFLLEKYAAAREKFINDESDLLESNRVQVTQKYCFYRYRDWLSRTGFQKISSLHYLDNQKRVERSN